MKLQGEHLLRCTPKSEMNGCGSKGIAWLIPNRLFLVDFTKACNIHDCYYYWIRFKQNKELHRAYADKIFLRNMQFINRTCSPTKIGYYARKPLIYLYYKSVRKFGHKSI